MSKIFLAVSGEDLVADSWLRSLPETRLYYYTNAQLAIAGTVPSDAHVITLTKTSYYSTQTSKSTIERFHQVMAPLKYHQQREYCI